MPLWPPLSTGTPEVETPECACQLARSEEELHALAPEWRQLYKESSPQNPFLSYEWTAACLRIRRMGTPFVLTCRVGPRLAGLAPLYLQSKGPFRVLRFIAEWSSDYLGFLCAADRPHIAERMLACLERLHSSWDIAVLRPLCPAYGGGLTGPVPAGLRAAAVDGSHAPYLELGTDWNELMHAGTGQIAHTRRWTRRFEREGGKVERLSGGDAARVFDELLEIESHSWKAQKRISWRASLRKRELLRSALETMKDVEVWLARLNARSIAYLLNLVSRERVMFYQGAYDQAYRKYYPGGVLHYHAIHAAWSAGLREYDLLTGDERYKSEWTTGRHRQRYLTVIPDTVRGRAAFASLIAPRWFLRQFRAAHTARAVVRRGWASLRRSTGRAED